MLFSIVFPGIPAGGDSAAIARSRGNVRSTNAPPAKRRAERRKSPLPILTVIQFSISHLPPVDSLWLGFGCCLSISRGTGENLTTHADHFPIEAGKPASIPGGASAGSRIVSAGPDIAIVEVGDFGKTKDEQSGACRSVGVGGSVRGLPVPVRDAAREGPVEGRGSGPGDVPRGAQGQAILFRQVVRGDVAGRHPQAQDHRSFSEAVEGSAPARRRPPGLAGGRTFRRQGTLDGRAGGMGREPGGPLPPEEIPRASDEMPRVAIPEPCERLYPPGDRRGGHERDL